MSAARQVVLDTETTGLEWQQGERLVEIGCVELLNRKHSGRHFHQYLNPQRAVGAGAQAIHGLTDEFLADKPRFADRVEAFIEFVADAELIIHNAAFDIGFLDNELALCGRPPIKALCSGVVDTLRMARELRPGKKNNLDALCSEYAIDNSGRQLHGALLDAELLADVYLSMTRGQDSLMMDLDQAIDAAIWTPAAYPPIRLFAPSEADRAGHLCVLAEIDRESKGKSLWRQPAG